MLLRSLARRFIALILTASIALLSTSCGTILYPERRGQPPGGPLDPGVVILDALGLLFFVIPGIAAFIIDFSNGTIYLPPPGYYPTSHRPLRRSDLRRVQFAKEDLTREKIEQTVSEHVGRPVTLEPGRYRAVELESLDEFNDQVERSSTNNGDSRPVAVRFRP